MGALTALLAVSACSGSDDPPVGPGPGGSGPVCTTCTPAGPMTYLLPSPSNARLWTATVMDKVLREAEPPTTPGDQIQIYAARNEFEPFQVVVNANADADVALELAPFSGPGDIRRVEIRRVGYVRITEPTDASAIPSGYVPDPLEPMSFGSSQPVVGGQNQPFWITVRVDEDTVAGDYEAALSVRVGSESVDIPVRLHVFDFALPRAIGFDGGWNASYTALGGGDDLDYVEQLKNFFFEHRLVPSGVAWPAGLNYNGGIEYDCATGQFVEIDSPYDFSQLGPKYIDGVGWNGVGFPSFHAIHHVDNQTPRPDEFCGVSRGADHYGTAEYNAAWSRMLTAIDDYLVAHGWENKAYYHTLNEPQDQADYDLSAFLADLTKTAAPHFRIALSEEPKPEIVDNPYANGHSYDIWWAALRPFEPTYANSRQARGETVWWYFLPGDLPPYFSPVTIDHPGIESRIPFWAAWKYRIKGFFYYSITNWGDDPYDDPRPRGTSQNGDAFLLYPLQNGQLVPSIRWELLREGEEDFEYLLLAAGGVAPATRDDPSVCDVTVESAVSSMTSYTRDPSALLHLRHQLGLMLEGAVDGCPVIDASLPGEHPRAEYYLNFQDPAGEPSADPLVVGGHEWIKIGWNPYDAGLGYGWFGPKIGDPSVMMYRYLDSAPFDETERSMIFDDWVNVDTFNWDIENGRYEVTVTVGRYQYDCPRNHIVVEGQVIIDDVPTGESSPYHAASVIVDVVDGNVTMEVGNGESYTMLDWMSIVPVD